MKVRIGSWREGGDHAILGWPCSSECSVPCSMAKEEHTSSRVELDVMTCVRPWLIEWADKRGGEIVEPASGFSIPRQLIVLLHLHR